VVTAAEQDATATVATVAVALTDTAVALVAMADYCAATVAMAATVQSD
jgi:hypothetical protein